MEARASSDLSFIGIGNISFIIMWPLHNQSYCNISMKNESNVIIMIWDIDLTFGRWVYSDELPIKFEFRSDLMILS
jgi:hypothetical protein